MLLIEGAWMAVLMAVTMTANMQVRHRIFVAIDTELAPGTIIEFSIAVRLADMLSILPN